MPTLRYVLFLSLMALLPINVRGQVPIDLSRAVPFEIARTMKFNSSISRIKYTTNFCGVPDLNVITTGVANRGRVTWATVPIIDTTNLFDWQGINAPTRLEPIDYDRVEPVEYVNSQGVIWRCSQGESPFPLMPIDTVANDVCSASPAFSGDVDDDGSLDVITEIGRNGVTTRVILGGPGAGRGCERVLVVPVVKSANKYNQTKAFYRSARGEWRLIQQERDSIDRAPRLQMYRVNFTRTNEKPEVTFTALGQYRGVDVTQIDEPFGELCVVVDSVNGIDHLLMNHRIGPPGSQWALERYDVTSGEIISSGEIVSGYNFYYDTFMDMQHSLGTNTPVIAIEYFFCHIDNITQPFARWNPKGSGTQPYAGMTAVNDQTGDGIPDLVVVGGSINGTMVVLTLDTVYTSVHSEDSSPSSLTLRIVDEVLEVNSASGGRLTVSIVSLEGKTIKAIPDHDVQPGLTRIPVAPTLQGLSRGQYVLRASINGAVQTLLLVR